jgi:catechol 2,3-dioxygenase-like lactoylglutathione lyase family enzyme
MLHHVSVGVRDVAKAAAFYDSVLKALGYERVMDFSPNAIAYGESKDRPQFWIGLPHDQNVANAGNGAHVGFSAASKEAVAEFHAAALKAGGSNNGEPGPRPDYGPDYYGAFIYDLDGNKIEAVLHLLVVDAEAEAAKIAARKKRRAERRTKQKAKRANRKGKQAGRMGKGMNKRKGKRKGKKAAEG